MLPKITNAIAQLIQPIASNAQNNRLQSFERFTPPKNDREQSQEESQGQPQEKEPAPDNVVPLRAGPKSGEQALAERSDFASRLNQLSSSLPLLGLLVSLKDSRKLLLGIGRRLYARMRKDQDKRRNRKGIILDIKA